MIEERKTVNYPKPFGFTYMRVGNAYITVSGMAQHLALEFTATDVTVGTLSHHSSRTTPTSPSS